MSSFTKYLSKFTKDISDPKSLTHLAFNGGKYNVPNECYNEFYETYYKFLMKGEDMYIIEKVNEKTKVGFFLDIEVPKYVDYKLKKNDIKIIIEETNKCIVNMFENSNTEYLITRRNDRYHINYYNVIVNSLNTQRLSKYIISSLPTEMKKLIDTSVYRNGLRLFGSKKSENDIKKEKENFEDDISTYSSKYEIYDIETNSLYDIKDTTFDDFMKLVIRRPNDVKLLVVKDTYKEVISVSEQVKPCCNIENTKITKEISELLLFIKTNNDKYLSDYNLSIHKVTATQNTQGLYCHYVSIDDHLCPFVCREHRRPQSPIYVEISINGIFVKCYDEDCLRRKYPDDGFPLPENFEDTYPELYMSMTSKYWKSDITVTADIKQLMEDSLSGSHYKIAKVIYNIYKTRFRIDDIKNPDWYEFDGSRWNKTHIMNILISEELQRYYKAIKISDVGAGTEDTKVSIMRNSLIDSIIGKLENVTFKKNIMTEMHYLFKSLEPNFMSKLDANPYLMGFKNGVYDLENQVFRNGQHKDYITLSTGYDYLEYDENLEEVKDIYKFLRQIMPNKNVLEYLLKILGRSLLGVCDEKFYIFTGLSGANGKSTLVNFLEYTLGDYMTSADVSLLTNTRALSSSASPDVIRLKGKRMVDFAEPESNDTIKVGIIKAFSGGDSIIARELYKAPVSFKLQASMILCTNDLPAISSIDGGIIRRLRILDFTSRFCDNPVKPNEFKIDPTIKTKIKNWRPFFMSILIHYYKIHEDEIKNTGKIEEPNEVKIATNKYKADNDKFNDYFNECVNETDGSFENIKNIYNHFMKWWANIYNTKTPDMKELKKSLKIKFGEEIERKNSNGVKQIGFFIKLTDNIIDDFVEDNDTY